MKTLHSFVCFFNLVFSARTCIDFFKTFFFVVFLGFHINPIQNLICSPEKLYSINVVFLVEI